jgi:hypothetical protein
LKGIEPKEITMNMKSSIASIATEIEKMPEHVEDARKAFGGWRDNTLRTVKHHPGRSILGAFAIGYVVAKVARYV